MSRQNDDAVVACAKSEHVSRNTRVSQDRVVKEIEIVSGFEDRRHHLFANQLPFGIDQVHAAGSEMRISIGVWQIKCNVVLRSTLAHQVAHPL